MYKKEWMERILCCCFPTVHGKFSDSTRHTMTASACRNERFECQDNSRKQFEWETSRISMKCVWGLQLFWGTWPLVHVTQRCKCVFVQLVLSLFFSLPTDVWEHAAQQHLFSTFLTLRSGVQRVCHETSDNMRNSLIRFFDEHLFKLVHAPICRCAVCSRIASRWWVPHRMWGTSMRVIGFSSCTLAKIAWVHYYLSSV